MNNFYGSEFIFDGVPSSRYDLRIFDLETGGKSSGNAGAESTIYEEFLYRKNRSNFFGRATNTNLEFDITVGSFNPISAMDRNLAQTWLTSRMEYKKFKIIQSDMIDYYFNVIFEKASNEYVGNLNQAFTLHARCDSGYAWEYPKTLTKSYTGGGVTNESFTIYNSSADPDYNYPIVDFTLNGVGTSFVLTNTSDNNRQYSFTGLSANENINTDNYNEILISSTGLFRLSKFNLHWFRLIPGFNSLNILGGISEFKLTTQYARKVGG
jgi:hypothetical protein